MHICPDELMALGGIATACRMCWSWIKARLGVGS